MKTTKTNLLIALVTLAAVATPLQAAHHNSRDSRRPNYDRQPEMRHYPPQPWSHPHPHRPHGSAQVMMVPGCYYPPPPPPPPPMVYWGYYPPPPPPPPIYYPRYQPGFNIMLSF